MLRWMAAAALAIVAPLATACPICPSEPLKYAFKRAPAVRIGENYIVVPGRNWHIDCGSHVHDADSPQRHLIERRALYAIARRIGGW